MDFLQSLDADVSVNLSGVQSSVTEELLQRSQVRSVFHHQRRGRVAKQVTRTALLDADAVEVFFDQVGYVVGSQTTPVLGYE